MHAFGASRLRTAVRRRCSRGPRSRCDKRACVIQGEQLASHWNLRKLCFGWLKLSEAALVVDATAACFRKFSDLCIPVRF
jgi:hypothetical protein